MTDEEMLAAVEALVDDPRLERFAPHYLGIARSAVVSHMFPLSDRGWDDVHERYHPRAVEIAVYLVNRRGSEGETSHQESGVSRSYETAGIPKGYFSGMPTYVGVPG